MTVERAAALLGRARSAVALTGAGVSTESGLPDFRSPQGVWAGVDPLRVASLTAFRRDPAAFYAFYRTRLAALRGAAPNPAHEALAALEHGGRLRAVITQNVDGLHQAAGSRRVLEVHGSLTRAACPACVYRVPIATLEDALDRRETPRCPECGAPLKPDVVLFEELLPPRVFAEAEALCQAADLLVVAGSSLQVMPVGGLPALAIENGARLIIVNRESTPWDAEAAVVIRENAGTALPRIAAALGVGQVKAAPAGEGRLDARAEETATTHRRPQDA